VACACGGGPDICRNPFALATWGKQLRLDTGSGLKEYARIILPEGAPPVGMTVLVAASSGGGGLTGTLELAVGGKATALTIPITVAAGAQFTTTIGGTSFKLSLQANGGQVDTALGVLFAAGWIYIPPCWRPRQQQDV